MRAEASGQRPAACGRRLADRGNNWSKLPHYVKDQLRRAALSVVLNLSEGYGRKSSADRVRFFQIALGSIRECQAIVEVERQSFTDSQCDLLDHAAASVFKLIRNTR